jgi:hypothetical protein
MITCHAIKRFGSLRPTEPGVLADIADGEQVRLVITRPTARSTRQHGLFFALLSVACEQTGWTIDQALIWTKIAVGHVDAIVEPNTGNVTMVPKSISFAKMDQEAFAVFFEDASRAVLNRLLPPGTGYGELKEEIFSRAGEKP